jgi:hypothetical protein
VDSDAALIRSIASGDRDALATISALAEDRCMIVWQLGGVEGRRMLRHSSISSCPCWCWDDAAGPLPRRRVHLGRADSGRSRSAARRTARSGKAARSLHESMGSTVVETWTDVTAE